MLLFFIMKTDGGTMVNASNSQSTTSVSATITSIVPQGRTSPLISKTDVTGRQRLEGSSISSARKVKADVGPVSKSQAEKTKRLAHEPLISSRTPADIREKLINQRPPDEKTSSRTPTRTRQEITQTRPPLAEPEGNPHVDRFFKGSAKEGFQAVSDFRNERQQEAEQSRKALLQKTASDEVNQFRGTLSSKRKEDPRGAKKDKEFQREVKAGLDNIQKSLALRITKTTYVDNWGDEGTLSLAETVNSAMDNNYFREALKGNKELRNQYVKLWNQLNEEPSTNERIKAMGQLKENLDVFTDLAKYVDTSKKPDGSVSKGAVFIDQVLKSAADTKAVDNLVKMQKKKTFNQEYVLNPVLRAEFARQASGLDQVFDHLQEGYPAFFKEVAEGIRRDLGIDVSVQGVEDAFKQSTVNAAGHEYIRDFTSIFTELRKITPQS